MLISIHTYLKWIDMYDEIIHISKLATILERPHNNGKDNK